MEEKIILVTGGSGLLGRGIENMIKKDLPEEEKWIFISSKDADLRNRDATKKIFMQHKPTHVIHFAAQCGGLYNNMRSNCDYLRENIFINDSILETSREFGVKKVISCISTCNFPLKISYPFDETKLHDGPSHPSVFGSAFAKRLIDIQNRAYFEKYKIKYTAVMPSNVFGPYDNFNIEDGHVIPGLIHKIYLAMKNNTPLTVWGSGQSRRQFIYVPDLAKLIIWAIREYDEVDPIILCDNEEVEYSIKEVVEMIVKAYGFKGRIEYDTSYSEGLFRKTASNAKLRKYLPDFQFTPIEEAIKESVDWFKNNYVIAQK